MACGSHYSHFRGARELAQRRQFSPVCVREKKRTFIYYISAQLTPSAFHIVAHAQPLHRPCPCRRPPPMQSQALPLPSFLGAAVFTSHWSSGKRDSLAGRHRLLSCHWQEAPVAPYAQASALTLFMLRHTL